MAMVRKTMEEIRREMTSDRRQKIIEGLKERPITYDPDCPPCSEEKLARFTRAVPRKSVS